MAYLDRLTATHSPLDGHRDRRAGSTHFAGASSPRIDAGLPALAALDRRRHIEPYLTATAAAVNSRTGAPLSVAERRAPGARGALPAQRHHRVGLARGTRRGGWCSARDIPEAAPAAAALPAPGRWTGGSPTALQGCRDRLAADALLLARATGLRIGELVDLELDCVHEIPGQGAWLKVPLGKLDDRTDGAARRGDRRP